MGGGFIHLHLATQDVGDLTGVQIPTPDGRAVHARPEWFPTEGSGIVFLDELNRAPQEVLQAMFAFITDGRIHDHRLPEGWRIVAAGNYQDEAFNVTDTSDAAWLSRFLHIHFEPTVEEFVVFAEQKGLDDIADFISENSDMLEVKAKNRPEVRVTPDRRSWVDMVGRLEKESMSEELRFELYQGAMGDIAAAKFINYKKSAERKIRLKNILRNYAAVRDKVKTYATNSETRFDALNAPLEELYTKLKENPLLLDSESVANLQQFMLDLPLELISQSAKRFKSLSFRHKDDLVDNKQFIEKLLEVEVSAKAKKTKK
jgi:hypothetical protein